MAANANISNQNAMAMPLSLAGGLIINPATSAERAHRSVFVGNIPYDATEEQLKEIFNQAGPVVSFRLVYDRETGKPKGYGFCEYQDVETSQSAMRNLNNHDFNGRPLRVGIASGENKDDKSMQQAVGGPIMESPYGDEMEPEKAPEAISKAVASLPPEQMFELMKQMKMCIQNNPNEARNMLLQNPQLAYALLQAQIVMKIVDPQVALAMLHRQTEQIPPLLPTDKEKVDTPPPQQQQQQQQQMPQPMGMMGEMPGGPGQNMGVPGLNMGGPGQNMGLPGLNMGGPGQNMGGPGPTMGGPGQNMGGPGPNMGGPGQNMGGPRQNMGGPGPNMGGPGQNMGGPGQNMGGPGQNMGGPGQNMGGPRQNMGGPGPNMGGPGQNMSMQMNPHEQGNRGPGPDYGRGQDRPMPMDMQRGGGGGGGMMGGHPQQQGRGMMNNPRMDGPRPQFMNDQRGLPRPDMMGRDMRGPDSMGGPPHGARGGPDGPGPRQMGGGSGDMRGGPNRGPPGQPGRSGGMPGGPNAQSNIPGIASASQVNTKDKEKAALIMQVLQLSDEQISLLPPDQRQSILILKDQISRSGTT